MEVLNLEIPENNVIVRRGNFNFPILFLYYDKTAILFL